MPATSHVPACRLYARPQERMFPHGQAEALASFLADVNRQTTVNPIGNIRELQLRADGTTIDGQYTYTTNGFIQLAKLLCPGASLFLPAVAGTTRSGTARDDYADSQLAVRMFNALVDLRFPLLSGSRLIRNEAARTLDGLVGVGHRYLENPRFYETIAAFIQDRRPDLSFKGSSVLGRRLLLWYANPAPVFTEQFGSQPWRFHAGCYFVNGEATGTSVRGTSAIFTRGGVCLGPYRRYGDRARHAGHDFDRRFGTLLETVVAAEIDWGQVQRNVQQLLATDLQLDRVRHRDLASRIRRLSRIFVHLGVPLRFALEAVNAAVYAGGDPLQHDFPSVNLTHRKAFDLLPPLLDVARRLDPSRREMVEIAAFEFLTGRINYQEFEHGTNVRSDSRPSPQ